jgi:hypothetical protein
MDAGSGEQEGHHGRDVANPDRADALSTRDQQGEGHDGQPAELQQRSKPDVRTSSPAQVRAMGVRTVADQCAERGEQEGQGDHGRHEYGRNL